MQVNKHFHSTLTLGTFADQDFKRRCLAMGSKHRSPGCKTWQETYFKIIRRKCAVCSVNTTAKLGLLLEEGPRWLVVCEYCQTTPMTPYRVVTRDTAIKKYGVPKEVLRTLNSKYRKIDDTYWVTDYLLSTIIRESKRLHPHAWKKKD